MKRILFLLLLALSQSPLYAVSFDMNDTALEIYEDIFSFKLVSAKQKAKEAIEDDKDNLVYEFLHLSANYFDLVNLPNDSKIESFSKEEDQVLENLKKLSDTEPFKKYAISDIYFHTAMFKMTQGDYLSGANLIRKANKLLEENKKAHPDFLINNKNYSLIKILVGSIPKKYRFIESLAGIDGDAPKGVRMLASVGFNEINAKFKYIQKESKLLYAIALFTIENNKELSFRIVKQECADYKTNLFSNYIYAIHATMQGENDLVLSLLNQKPKYNELEIHYMDYMKGLAQLRKLDFTAIKTFKRYLETAESSYNKYNAYKHLYWAYKLKGEESNAKLYKDKAKKEREDKFEGDFDFDANYYNKRLLEIRLLYDGGYYAQAKLKIKYLRNRPI